MIKIQLYNWNKGRNNHTFRPFLMYGQYFKEMGIEFVENGSYDFKFIGMADFLDKGKPLQQSIDEGLNNLKDIGGDYFLFDGSDSTSLMASYEVFEKSNAIYLYKNQLLSREAYSKPSAFNKWFFGDGSDLDLSYAIDEETFSRIKLSGWNLGYYNPDYFNFKLPNDNKAVDVCAIYQVQHKPNSDHNVRNDSYYINHRKSSWDELSKIEDKYQIIKDKLPYDQYITYLKQSKIGVSPFGMGEVCFRDFEIIQNGTILLKPSMDVVNTIPNPYIPNETYIPCKEDWSNLNELIEFICDSYDNEYWKNFVIKSQEKVKSLYSIENLLVYWYNQIKSFPNIVIE